MRDEMYLATRLSLSVSFRLSGHLQVTPPILGCTFAVGKNCCIHLNMFSLASVLHLGYAPSLSEFVFRPIFVFSVSP